MLALVESYVRVGPRPAAAPYRRYGAMVVGLEGGQKVSSRQVFGRDLMAAFPSVTSRRHNGKGRFY